MTQRNGLGGKGWIIAVIVVLAILALFMGDSDDSYKNTLESGQKKYYSGQPMTQQEYNAVKNINKWKSSQGSKTYSEWGN